jgi:hypothetical protein
MAAVRTQTRGAVAIFSALSLIASLRGCSNSQAASDDDETSLSDEDSTGDSDEVKGGETYGAYDERRDEIDPSPGQVGEYGCTQDCSGHDAGYRWASERGISSVDDCGGKSWSFEEGCKADAAEQGGEE